MSDRKGVSSQAVSRFRGDLDHHTVARKTGSLRDHVFEIRVRFCHLLTGRDVFRETPMAALREA